MRRVLLVLLTVSLFVSTFAVSSVAAQETATATLTAGTNFRAFPSRNAPKIQALASNSKYPVVGKSPSGYWYELEVNGAKGWVCKFFTQLSVRSSVLPVTSKVDENCEGRAFPGSSKETPIPPTPQGPGVQITSVPPFGQGGALFGRVTGIDAATHKVACYLFVNGGWWSKPYRNEPTVDFDAKTGIFACNVNTGGIDYLATRYLVVVLPRGFDLSDKLSSGGDIHSEVLRNAAAAQTYDRPK